RRCLSVEHGRHDHVQHDGSVWCVRGRDLQHFRPHHASARRGLTEHPAIIDESGVHQAMKTATWFFYSLADGRFDGRSVSCPESVLDLNIPEGYGAREDVTDWLSQRVDLETGQIVDYVPPQPSDDHEWIHDDAEGNRVRRWLLKPEVAERRARKAAALKRIMELEAKLPRAMTERALGITPTESDIAAGAMTLEQINEAIAEQRAIVKGAA